MKGEMEKSGRFLVIAIFFLFFISTAQGAWDNDDLMYAKWTSEIRLPVHNIDTEEDFENIQTAIDDPDTKDGHTISVDAGIYRERVVINKQLKLIGANKDTTIIDGYGSGKCIQVTADNVEISGFTIKNGDSGVYLESSNCCVIDNYIISVDFDGISLRSNSVNNTIAHNSLSKVKGKGVRLSSSCNNLIHDNDLSDNGKGISLSSSHNNIIYHNGLTNNSNCGICLSSSNNNTIQDNDLSGCDEGISLRGCNKNYIYHNNFIDNIIQASDSSDTNRWDKGPIDGGNYWSDHKCTGNPSDGNQPYIISGGIMGATDFYPFMDRDGWLTPPSSPTLTDPGTNDTDGNYIVRWSSVSSATNYTLEEDTSSLFSSPTKIYSGSETTKEITGKSEGTYYYRVMACNECGCSKWSNREDINIRYITIDTIPPVIYHENITKANEGENISIFATITDDTKVASATLSYRITDSEEAWITTPMDHIGDNYSATIPASNVTTAGVEYYIKAVDDSSNTAYKPEAASKAPYSITVKVNVGYAIIIAGRRDKDLGHNPINITAYNAYDVLLNRCFTGERIFYLNPSKGQYVDRKSSSKNIDDAISWAYDNVSANVPLFIYMVGHCENDAFIVNGKNDILTASSLNNFLNLLTNEKGCEDITVVCEACNSGSFIDDLSYYNNLSKCGRIIVSSAGVDGDAFINKEGAHFSLDFFGSISNGKTIKEAFEDASNNTYLKGYYPEITPLLDDNGDGKGHNISEIDEEGQLAGSRYIGRQCGDRDVALTNAHSYNIWIPAIKLEEV